MKLLVVSINYAPEPTGTGLYTGGLCAALAARGHDVSVVCGYPFYPEWRVHPGYRAWWWSTERVDGVRLLRCPVYVPAQVNGLKRLLHYASFALNSLPVLLWLLLFDRPRAFLCVAPTLMAATLPAPIARLLGVRTWIHIQDFEVEAGFATDQIKSGSLVGKAAMLFERLSFRFYDFASTISPAMVAKLKTKVAPGVPVAQLRNWAEIDAIRVQSESAYRSEWAIATPHVALYSGSIAKKQGIDMLIDVARELEARGDTTVIICGNGPEKDQLAALAEGVSNIQLRPLQPMERLGDLLALATVHLLPQKKDAADLVLPSKMANMLASGRPIVAGAAADTSLAGEIEGCGVAVEPENAAAMAAAIGRLIDDEAGRARFGAAARKRAEDHWAKGAIIDNFESAAGAL